MEWNGMGGKGCGAFITRRFQSERVTGHGWRWRSFRFILGFGAGFFYVFSFLMSEGRVVVAHFFLYKEYNYEPLQYECVCKVCLKVSVLGFEREGNFEGG